ncbi:MAG: ferredoxin reductase [Gammaproteobacteria bacterium]
METEKRAAHPPIRWQTATIRRIVQEAPRVKSFFIELPQPFAFLAGQHVDVRLTAPDGYQAQRSYSIASAPERPGPIEITIDRLDDGEVSTFFHDVATVGDTIELRGPFGGHFIWTHEDGGPVVLAGGGSGVVPLMSIVRHRFARQLRTPMLLLFSARTWGDLIYRDELLACSERKNGFELAIALTREAARRAGDYSRRIDREMFIESLSRLPGMPNHVYVCGSNAFAEAAAEHLIAAAVPKEIIRIERYGG